MKMLMIAALTALPLLTGAAQASEPASSQQNYPVAENAAVAAEQKAIYDTVIRYQNALNSGDTNTILSLFAQHSYSQWNEKTTADTTEKRRRQYDTLFQTERFETQFAFDTIGVNGNMAYVRTHHHRGATVTRLSDGATLIDLNREVFILEKQDGAWKIVLYTFNTNPVQGVA